MPERPEASPRGGSDARRADGPRIPGARPLEGLTARTKRLAVFAALGGALLGAFAAGWPSALAVPQPLRGLLAIAGLVVGAGWVGRSIAQTVARLEAEARARRDAEQKARAADLAKTELLANLSHELRTPLVGILGMSQVALASDGFRQETRRQLEIIDESGQTLLGLVDDLLDYASLHAGRFRLHQTSVDLRRQVTSVVELMRSRAGGKGLDLRVRGLDTVPRFVVTDALRLRQVLLNLLGNAVKFTAEGHVSLAVEVRGDSLRFEVEDTGIGIATRTHDRLFAPFQQGDSSTSRLYGGTGLGLSISRRLVEALGGTIGVEGGRGAGSLFWVELPLVEPPAPIPAESGGLEPAALGTEQAPVDGPSGSPAAPDPVRVLVVDDNEVNRIVTSSQLEILGFEVVTAASGREALDQLQESTFGLVIMDCQMPGLDGYETTRRLRETEGRNRSVPVIALTAHAFWQERQRCLAAGMDDYLSKPVATDDLGDMVRRWLDWTEVGTEGPAG